ncbi:hypothetical protein [uncultured Kosakonia sp.]|uniref:hypothetical protein n=1 Tax=uncultured Kosakonia sp. TaxID=1588927 RepID=UPI002592D8E8|nr:hypothetical protein [uncultured Kosakonia sp.]
MPDGAALIRPTNRAVIIAGWRSAYPAYKPCRGHFRVALRLSGLQNCVVVIAGWRCAYPAYKTVPWSLPDGASLTRPTEHTSLS